VRKFLLFQMLLAIFACCFSCSGDKEPHAGKKPLVKQYAPREGAWRALKLMEAALNHRNFEGYLKVFDGAAAHVIRRQVTAAKFRAACRGRYRLHSFEVVKEHSRSLATVKYVLRQSVSGMPDRLLPGQGVFSAHRSRKHWVIISFK
jgi:hypothetical protein